MSHSQEAEEGSNPNPAANGPVVKALEDYDFTHRPSPDGSHLLRALGVQSVGGPQVVPGGKKNFPAPTTPRLTKDGPQLHRNPNQVSMGPPFFPKRTRRRTAHEVDAEVAREMKDMFAQDTDDVQFRGRRMVVVDETFYGKKDPHNWRPQPIRKGAGKGPRVKSHMVRC